MKEISGKFNQHDVNIAIVVADFNDTVTRQLKEGAINTLLKFGLACDQINVYHVPGAFEIPFTGRIVKSSVTFYRRKLQTVSSSLRPYGVDYLNP